MRKAPIELHEIERRLRRPEADVLRDESKPMTRRKGWSASADWLRRYGTPAGW